MLNARKALRFTGLGIAALAVSLGATARPAAAQTPLVARAAQVRQFGGDHDRNFDRDRDHDRWQAQQERRRFELRQAAERQRREAFLEAQRRREWLRDHQSDRDRHDDFGRHDRNDSGRDWHNDHR